MTKCAFIIDFNLFNYIFDLLLLKRIRTPPKSYNDDDDDI